MLRLKQKHRSASVYIMALLYIAAGINHLVNTRLYLSIMPPWLPYPDMLVYVSGVFEIVFGILIIPVKTRRVAAWGIILLLIAVYPANIQMAINYYRAGDKYFWLTLIRLPFQFVLIWWAYNYTFKRSLIC